MVRTRIMPGRPAMVLEADRRYLIVTDLHIGFEEILGAGGISVGRNTATGQMISELVHMIDDARPDALVLLGDIKSSTGSITRSEWDDVPRLLGEMSGRLDTILIPGNHDSGMERLAPDGVVMSGPSGMVIHGVLLTHGHAMPSENLAHVERIIMGHLHPAFFHRDSVLNGSRVWVYARADRSSIFASRGGELDITVVPSFNRYLHAARRRRRAGSISPIMQRARIRSARIVTLDGSIIGDEGAIHDVL